MHVFALAASAGGGAEGPYGGTAAAVPGTVQAANYDTGGQGVAYNVTSVNGTADSYRSGGVDLETCSDTGCGYDLGWTATGQWFKYTVSVATAGTSLSGAVNVPDTGGWQDWETVTASVTLPAGRQTLAVDQDNGGWNLYYMTFAAAGGSTTNLALNKPVTASSNYQTYVPSNATDGNTSTYWESTDGAGYRQTVTVNLGSAQSIGSITLDLPPSSSWSTRTETLSVLSSTNERRSASSWPRPSLAPPAWRRRCYDAPGVVLERRYRMISSRWAGAASSRSVPSERSVMTLTFSPFQDEGR